MFVAHYAFGLALFSKKKGSKQSFFILVLGTQVADLLWGLFTLLGIEGGISGGNVEHNYFDIPWSHSLLMIIIWSLIYGYGSQLYINKLNPELSNFGVFSGFSVFSHWLLDFPVHNDDMLVFPTGELKVPTLFLWEYPIVTFILEMVLVGTFWYMYCSAHPEEEFKSSNKPFIILILLLTLHIIGYFPTLLDSEGTQSNAASGIVVAVMIVLIAVILTWLHTNALKNKKE